VAGRRPVGWGRPTANALYEGVELDQRNVRASFIDDQTSKPTVSSAGDIRRGQSLVMRTTRESMKGE
jgi:NADPH-dependent glutamate synthase beta subunit-like oxidoreductase